jgi:predicted MFS family arabinose efflux permease
VNPADPASDAQRAEAQPNRRVVITALGLTQIFAWGSSYYLLGVLATPIAAETGWSLTVVVGGLSLGLLAAGVVSPRIGRAIARHGGRPVLAASSLLLAAGLALLGLAQTLPTYLAAWLVIGLGMGAGLYDAAFGTLGVYYGESARRAITTLTLWGGFASTVCWPISAFLVESLGWRGACFVYAGLQVALALPAHWFLLPRARSVVPLTATSPSLDRPAAGAGALAFALLAGIVTIGGAIASLFTVHFMTLLQARDLTLGAAVALGAVIGPAQVGARVVEMAFGRHYHPIWTMLAALGLVACGLGLLALGFPVIAVALVLYGAGNGIYSIGRGTLPLALFGPGNYPVLMGRLALPSLVAQALAPVIGAQMIERGGPDLAIVALTGLAGVNVLLVLALWMIIPRTSAASPVDAGRPD